MRLQLVLMLPVLAHPADATLVTSEINEPKF